MNRSRVEGDLNDELRDNLDREIEHEIAAGLSPEEARRRALSALAGTESKAALRIESRGAFWMNRGVMRGQPRSAQ